MNETLASGDNPSESPISGTPPQKPSHRGAWVMAGLLATLAGAFFVGRHVLPFGIEMPEYTVGEGSQSVDPRSRVSIESIGLGTQLTKAELRDESGRTIAEASNTRDFSPDVKLDFGKKYTLAASAERVWLGQKTQSEVSFSTISLPRVESQLRQDLTPDGNLHLKFSEPVGEIKTSGELKLNAQPDAGHQNFTLTTDPSLISQGQTYSVDVNWETRTGVPLEPFKLEVSTAPPLTASIASNGMNNLGLAMPVQVDFSEPLFEREKATDHIKISTQDGQSVPGKWLWFGKQRVQFRPTGGWPAESTINVSIDPAGTSMKSARGGFLPHPVTGSFTTGPDKRIEVFLDKQRVNIIENGQVVKTMKASTGKAGTPTVTGSFYIYARFPKKTMRATGKKPGQPGYYEVKDVPYAQYFYEGYAFHGAFWHNNFGRPASHGCVNLATRKKNGRKGVNEDAGWLYEWASLGVPVTVHRSSPAQSKVATSQ